VPDRQLPEEIRTALTMRGGLLTTADCRAAGLSYGQVERLVRRGRLILLARGVYGDARDVNALPPWPRFELRSRAFVVASPVGAMASDWSAVAVHRLPTMVPPPPVPSVLRPGPSLSGSNRTCHGRTRFADVEPAWWAHDNGTPVLAPAFAAVDLARRSDRLAALAVADAVARREGGRAGMTAALVAMNNWPAVGRARWVVEHSDGDAESPLESAGRYAFLCGALPPPVTNAWVGEVDPRFRLDHFWPQFRLAAEGDGISKYALAVDPRDMLRREKEREWWLHRKGIRVIRYGWKLAVHRPAVLVDQCRLMMAEQALPISGELRWWPSAEGSAILGLPR
jgi:hypothetical protein